MSLTGLLQARSIEKEGNLGTAVSRNNLNRGFELISSLTEYPALYIIKDKGLVLAAKCQSQVSSGMVFIPDETNDSVTEFSFSELEGLEPLGGIGSKKINDVMKAFKHKYKATEVEKPLMIKVEDNTLTVIADHSAIKKGIWEYKTRLWELNTAERIIPFGLSDRSWLKIENWKLKKAMKATKLQNQNIIDLYCEKGETNLMFHAKNDNCKRNMEYITYLPDTMTQVIETADCSTHWKHLNGLMMKIDCTKGAAWKGKPCSDISIESNKALLIAGIDTKGRTKNEGLINTPRFMFSIEQIKPKDSYVGVSKLKQRFRKANKT